MSPKHFGRFPRDGFYFDTDLLSFFCNIHLLVVYFNTCYYPNVNELQKQRLMSGQIEDLHRPHDS